MITRNTIKLSKIEIVGFQSYNKVLTLDFADNNISIIFGENGSGKTTFLKIMNAILKQDSSILYNERIEHIEIVYILNNEETKVLNIAKNIDYNEEEENERYDWSEFNQSELTDTLSLSFGIERGVVSSTLKIDTRDIIEFMRHPKYRRVFTNLDHREFAESMTDYLKKTNFRRTHRYTKKNELSIHDQHAFLQNIKMDNIEELLLERYRYARNLATEQIQNALFETLSFIFDEKSAKESSSKEFQLSEKFISSLLSSKERLIEALDDDMDENKFKIKMIDILATIEDRSDVIEKINTHILYSLINNMINELELEKLLLSSINTLTEQFNKFLGKDKKLVINYNEIYVSIEDEPYSLNVLSSGERHMFTFLSLIIIEGSSRDFIFIDEPEISLNIKWQRVLMKLLHELAPRTQIIVASHSPQIAKKMPKSLIELIANEIN